MEDSREHNLAETITDGINPFNFNKEEFIKAMSYQHPTLRQKFTGLCLAWIQHVGSDKYRFDGRDEYSHEQCEKLVKLMSENDINSFMPTI